ncbi:MAG: PKD domain-containing protein, partial [Nitrospirota bacterium]
TYRVMAVDTLGIESLPSNEATGDASDDTPPAKPVIFYPTVAGKPVVLYEARTDTSGTAELGSTVELFRDGLPVSKTTALENDVIQSITLDYSGEGASLSPDEKILAYSYNGSIWLKTLTTGNITQIIQQGTSPLWSPDGRRLAYIFMDSNWNDRIGIYNIETGSSALLTDDITAYESSPSWSSDGGKFAFISNRGGSQAAWVKNLASGSIVQVTHNGYPSNSKLSPDGRRLAYFEYQYLYIVDILNGETIQVDVQTDSYSLDWSPDSKGLVYVSSRNGNADIFVLDINTQNQIQITDSPRDEFNPMWSPDGLTIAFAKRESEWSNSIWVTSSEQNQERLIQQGLHNLNYLSWARSGGITFIDQNILNIVYLKGHFCFKDVELNSGENIFHTTAIDSSGNLSLPSEEISVVFDTSLMPDMETTMDDILIYPPYPMAGEELAINVVVWNKGQVEVRDVDVDIYLWDSSGNLELLKSEKIPYIAADSGEVMPISWDSTGKAGTNTVIVVIDPEDKVSEVFETNNYAEKEFYVADTEGIAMDTILNSNEYKGNQDVNININLRNSGPERDVVMEVWIEDGNGYVVTLLNTIRTHLSYASEQNYSLLWNTGSTYAGSYRVHTLLKNPPDILTENITPFTILPDIDIESTLVIDKTNYGSNEDMFVNFNVRNNGRNYVIPELNLKVRIVDGVDKGLFIEDRNITNLLPGVTTALSSIWNTGLNLSGDYSVILEIYLDSKMVSSKSVPFKIDETIIITGNITVTPSVVILGNTVRASYTIQNIGNADAIGLTVKVSVIDPETQDLMDTKEETIDFGVNTMRNGQFVFSTLGYKLKTYTMGLQYMCQGNQKNIASISFTVRDGTPPVVSIISPVSGSQFSSSVEIAALVLDDASGVDKVEYQMDDGQWNLLPISDISRGIYKTTWTPTVSDVGMHIISFRASDKAVNTSSPVSTTITIDLMPPVANAGPDQNVITGELVTLNGSESYDPEGAMITFLWSFLEVPSGSNITDTSLSDVTSVKPTFTPDVDGRYSLKLIVNDGELDSTPDEVVIIATTPNVAPNANAGPDQNVFTGTLVQLDGSGSNDPDKGPQVLSYLWSFAELPQGSGLTDDDIIGRNHANASFITDVDGSYVLRLVVGDGDLTSNDDVVIISKTPNVPPNANAGDDITIYLGETAVLNGSTSNDPDNGPSALTFSWKFVSLPTGSQIRNEDIAGSNTPYPSFIPDVAETYVLELMVSDGQDVDFDNVAVTVVSECNVRGDLDDDCDVDKNDLNILLLYRNKPASNCPDCDLDGDGKITALDARKLVLLCTRPRCACK